MASTEKPLTYEEQRQSIIRENKRRMKELGLPTTPPAKAKKQSTIRKNLAESVSRDVENFSLETRRSSRAASRPRVDYKESGLDIRPRGCRVARRPLRRGSVSTNAKNGAAARAALCVTSYPSFVKAMLKSHTSGGFWLGLPSDFCSTHFVKDDLVVLEDEAGMEWECVYLHHKHGLSGGWRGFSIDHELDDGDAVVFELVASTRLKVHITRASESGAREPSSKGISVAQKKNYQYVVRNSENVHVHSVIHKALKKGKEENFIRPVCGSSKLVSAVKRKLSSSGGVEVLTGEDVLDNEGENAPTSDIWPKETAEFSEGVVRSKQDVKVRPVSRNQRIFSPGLPEETLKAAVETNKREIGQTQTRQKAHLGMARKESRLQEVEKKQELPPGTRLKPVGVCSIARRSAKRKLPVILPTRKHKSYGGPKSVKVH